MAGPVRATRADVFAPQPELIPGATGVTLDSLIDSIRGRMGDYPTPKRRTDTGDGSVTAYFLDQNVTSVTATIAGVVTTDFTVNEESGWLVFTTAPTGDVVIDYNYVVWSDTRITKAINSSINELFGKWYVWGANDNIVSDGSAEFIAQTSAGVYLLPEDRITRVEYWTGDRWVRTDRWRVQVQGVTKVVIFEQAPASGTKFRITYNTRPGNLTLPTDSLEANAFMPARAEEPIILLSCSTLMPDRMHRRIRDDRGHNTQNDNTVKSYEIQNDAQFLRAQAMLIAQSLKMDAMQGRVTL